MTGPVPNRGTERTPGVSVISILHLEDSPLDAELILAQLTRGGFDAVVDRAATRGEFVAALDARRHDVILADYALPGFDGLEALEVARERAPETPFLFVSGMLGEEVATETLKSGATDYVLKQRLDRLAPAVRRALSEARERDERKRAQAALREGEARFRLILDSVTDYAVMTTDPDGRVEEWSAGAERMFGHTAGEARGRPVAFLYTPEDVVAGVPGRELERSLHDGRAEDERWHLRRDGSRFWGSGVVVPLRDGLGRLRGFAKVLRDFTERKRVEDAMREADRRKDEFLAMLAHELRNPLSAIGNAAQLARRPGLPADRVEWSTGVIAHQVRHLARLVDDLLDVARINRGKVRLRTEPVDLAAVVRRAVEASRPLIEERGHELTVAVGPGLLCAEADPTRYEQAVVNLLMNAAKYTDKGGHVALSVAREGGDAVVRVKDDGIGMTAEMLARVFDLFAQADETLDRSKGGLGIGLTLARMLAELHGGTLSATSEGPGRGSEFTLRVPALAEPGHAPPAPGPAGAAEPAAAPARVLVVDDNVQTACTLAELLRGSGHTVCLAHDGGEAVEAARRHAPEVVLLDIGLPVLDGYQVAREIRREERLKNALLIAITGYGGEQAVLRSHEAGFDHHMVKPVDIDDLLSMLARPTRPRAAAHELRQD